MNPETQQATTQRSTFVNVLAWIFIILGGFATLISIMQNIMVHLLFNRGEMATAMRHAEKSEQMPAFFGLIFSHFELYVFFFLVVCLVTFISAIALLKRKNWARKVFVVLMGLGIVWNVGGVVLQFMFMGSMPGMAGHQVPVEMETMMTIMKIFTMGVALLVTLLFGWIIKRLTSKPIRAEFC